MGIELVIKYFECGFGDQQVSYFGLDIIPIVSAAETSWVATHGGVDIIDGVILKYPEHLTIVIPSGMADQQIGYTTLSLIYVRIQI